MRKFSLSVVGFIGVFTSSLAFGQLVWTPTTGSNVPSTAVAGGKESNNQAMYLCRGKVGANLYPGKTRKEFNGCNVSSGGKEVAVNAYEVVTSQPSTYTWQATSGAQIPSNAVQGGQDNVGALMICRANWQGGVHMGYTRKEFNACNFSYGGVQQLVASYEVLIAPMPVVTPPVSANNNVALAAAKTAANNARIAAAAFAKAHIAAAGKVTDSIYSARQLKIAQADADAVKSRSAKMSAHKPITWVDASNGQLPNGAVIAGKDLNGAKLAVCRASYNGGLFPGKVLGNTCNFAYTSVDAATNVALKKPASQSSNYSGSQGLAATAVDGLISGSWPNTNHTNNGASEFWMVDLQGAFSINTIRIYNRTDCCAERIVGAKVQVLDAAKNVVYTGPINSAGPSSDFKVPAGTVGNFVRVINAPNVWLHMGEVQVFANAAPVEVAVAKYQVPVGTMSWIAVSNGSTAPKAIVAGNVVPTATPANDKLYICRAPYNGGVLVGHLQASTCDLSSNGKTVSVKDYQVALDHGATAGTLNKAMSTIADKSNSKAQSIHAKILAETAAAKAAAAKALQDYKIAIAAAAVAQANAGITTSTPVESGEINYVAMVSGSANLGGGVTASGNASVDYGVNGQLTKTGVSGSYSFVAQATGSVTYGDENYNTTVSGTAKYEQSVAGCAGLVDKTACLRASANNTASLEGKVSSNVALGGGTTLTSGVTGTLSSGYYGDAGFTAGPSGASGALEGKIGTDVTAVANYGVYNDGYGGGGGSVGVSAGDAISGGGKGSATYTDGTLKVEVCGEVEFVVGLDICIDGQVNVGGAINALTPVVMQGANYLVQVAPGIYNTASTEVQKAGVTVYKSGQVAVDTLAQVSVSSANTVAAGAVSTANTIAKGTVDTLYTVGAVTAGAANTLVKGGAAAAEVVATNVAQVKVVADVAVSVANKVASGVTSVANTVASGVTGVANTVASGVTGVANTVGSGVVSVANTVGNAISSAFSGW